MPVAISWYEPGRIIYERLWGEIKIQTVAKSAKYLVELMNREGEDPAIHLIVDARQMKSATTNILQIREAIKPAMRHPMIVWGVFVNAPDPLYRSLSYIVLQVFNVRWRTVDSLEDAVHFLQRIDDSLPELTVYEPPDDKAGVFE